MVRGFRLRQQAAAAERSGGAQMLRRSLCWRAGIQGPTLWSSALSARCACTHTRAATVLISASGTVFSWACFPPSGAVSWMAG